MELYRYMKDENGTGAYMHYKIMEMQTGHIIRTDLPFNDAKNITRRLNRGGGFAGWTPEFMLQRLTTTNEGTEYAN
jgi:hypothetical protein